MAEQPQPRLIGVGDLLRNVNLRDFADMIRGELGLVAESARAALRSSPFVLPLVLVAVLLRLVLLLAVLLVFGVAILVISGVRSVVRLAASVLRGARRRSSLA
ncbi:MAG: hypothetical protein HY723_00470 [Chloroflexi bacterium]|nr:hypothetical protein [Chloroflexota bacterium]